MKRRKFLRTSIAGLTIAGITYYYLNGFSKSFGTSIYFPQFLPQIMGSNTIEEIGLDYLEQNLNNASSSEIKRKLIQSGVDNSTSINELNDLILQEYSNGNISSVRGWVLSKIELLQCSLYVVQN